MNGATTAIAIILFFIFLAEYITLKLRVFIPTIITILFIFHFTKFNYDFLYYSSNYKKICYKYH